MLASEFDDDTDDILSGLDTTPDALGMLTTPSGGGTPHYSRSTETFLNTTRGSTSTETFSRCSNPPSSRMRTGGSESANASTRNFSFSRSGSVRRSSTNPSPAPISYSSTRSESTTGHRPLQYGQSTSTTNPRMRRNPSSSSNFSSNSIRSDVTIQQTSTISTRVQDGTISGSTIRTERIATPSTSEDDQRASAHFAQPGPAPKAQRSTSSSSGFHSSKSSSVNTNPRTMMNSTSSSTNPAATNSRSWGSSREVRLYTPTVVSAVCRRRGAAPGPSPLDVYRDAVDERDRARDHVVSSAGQTTPSLGMRSRLPAPEVRREAEVEDEGALSEGLTTETDDSEPDLVTCIVTYAGKIGLAYYDVETHVIHMMRDLVDPGDYSTISKLVQRIGCKMLVTSAKMDRAFMAALNKALRPDAPEAQSGSSSSDGVVETLPNPEFDLEAAKRRILAHAHFLPEHYNETQRAIRLNSLIPFSNVCMVRATGGLIRFLTGKRIGVSLHDDDGSVRVLGYKAFSLEDMLYIDESSYCSLDIMRPKISHSARFKNKMTYSEQDISLLGLMNRCRSYIGAKQLKRWFQHPVTDRAVLEGRLDSVSLLMNVASSEAVTKMRQAVKGISSVAPILTKMEQNGITLKEWKCVYNTVSNAHSVVEAINYGNLQGGIFTKIREAFGNDVARLKRFIDEIIDFETFALKGRFSVRPGLDPDLDEKKRNYYGLPALLTDIANEQLVTLPPQVDECSVNYMPQIGYLLCIPFTGREGEDQYEIDGLTYQFMNRGVAHYKNEKMWHLDYALGDLLLDIIDHEMHIMYRLQDSFIALSASLHQVVSMVAELDCLLAFSSCAQEFSWVRPRFVDDDRIDIVDGRHAIMEHRVDQFVSNDYCSSPGAEGKIKIITGPNISGKSVYLKQTALIVFMAHLGSYVPAQSCTLGRVDSIFTCIWAKESVSTGLSSFMVDINMMFRACREATSRSLVIVDEFGKGTEMTDGLALLAATIKSFVDLGPRSPHGLFSTHFHEIVQQDLLPDSNMLKYQMMSVMEMNQELVLLYKLVEGSANFSHALHVAARMGLDENIINRARDVTERMLRHEKLYPDETEHEKKAHAEAKLIVDALFDLDLDNEDTTEVEQFLARIKDPHAGSDFYTTPEGSDADSDFIL